MLKYTDLTAAQKRFVDAAIEARPTLATQETVTLKECAAVYYQMRDTRTGVKGEKIGYPNWLYAANKVSRGVYAFPFPGAPEIAVKEKLEKSKLQKIIDTSDADSDFSDEDFLAEIRANGIEV